MGFKEIIGQDRIVQYLKATIQNHRIGHGYIFDGPEGIGKELTARAFAQAIECRSFIDDVCGVCSSCMKFQSSNHPDIQVIEPDGNSIKNKQIEELQQDVMMKPYESYKKIYMIKDAQGMTVSAQNRLLKTLEEPPEHAIFILITSNGNSLLPTIRSRCQILRFQRIGEAKIEEFMMKRYSMDGGEAKLVAAFSDGVIGKAIGLKESQDFKARREESIELLDELLKQDAIKAFTLVEFFDRHKGVIDEVLDFILFWFRDLMVLKETGEERFLINQDKKSILQNHLNRIGYDKTSNIIAIIEKTKNDIKANVNFQLAIEMLLLSIQEVSNGNSSRRTI